MSQGAIVRNADCKGIIKFALHWSKMKFIRCLTVGMKPELVDTTLKRKERERQMQENVDDRRKVFQEPENGKIPQIPSVHIAENKTKELVSECPREVRVNQK
jgi:hypothetical protein